MELIKIAQNIQDKCQKHEKVQKQKHDKKLKSNTTSYTQPLLWDMKVECFDPTCWSIWLTIFSFQWMQELLLRCPVRISMIDYVSVALTTAVWKPRFFFPFFEIFIVLLWFAVFPVLPLKPLSIIFPDLFKVLLPVLFAVLCIFRRLCWSHFVSNEPLFKIKHSIIRVLVFDCLFMQWSGFFTFLRLFNHQSRICVAGHLSSTNMTEI